jgi:DNA-binding beta-propeller fold protein YncE
MRAGAVVVVGGLLAACAAVVPPTPSGPPSPSIGPSLAPAGAVVRSLALQQHLLGVLDMVAEDGSVWVTASDSPHGWLLRFDAASGRQLAKVPVGWAPTGLMVDGNQAWVADSVGDGSLAGADQNQVEVIDAATSAVRHRYAIELPMAVAGLGDAVWVLSSGGQQSTLRRLVPDGPPALTLPEAGARQLVAAGHRLWTATWNATGGTDLWGIDPHASEVPKPLAIPGHVRALVSDGERLYAIDSPSINVVSQIDLESGEALASSSPFDGLQAVSAGNGVVWVAAAGQLHRLSDLLDEEAAPISVGEGVSAMAVDKNVWLATQQGLVEVEP